MKFFCFFGIHSPTGTSYEYIEEHNGSIERLKIITIKKECLTCGKEWYKKHF